MEAHNKTVQTMITSSSRPLYRALCTLLLCIAVLWAMPKSARAQLLASEYSSDSVGEFNATTGALINPSFITGLNGSSDIAFSDNSIFVANYADAFGENAGTTVGKYNATTGAAINASFIKGLSNPSELAVVPEPSALSMIAVGGVALLGVLLRRRHRVGRSSHSTYSRTA